MLHPAALEAFADTILKITKTAEESSPAALVSTLLPHQVRVIERMQHSPGLVVAHGTGSGKTFTSIAAAVNLKPDHIEVLVPAALQENYKKEIAKHVSGDLPVTIGSLQKAVLKGNVGKSDLLIVDEAHKARDPHSKTYSTLSHIEANKRMLLTASPVYNKPEDVASLVNLAAGDKVLPEGAEFAKRFVNESGPLWRHFVPFVQPRPSIQNKKQLERVLQKWVDYHKDESGEFPDKEETRVRVPMSKQQTAVHNAAQNALPPITLWRMKRGLPPNKQDLAQINKFQSQSRQASVSLRNFTKDGVPEPTPKVLAAAQSLVKNIEKNPEHKALVYSNYLSSLDDYESEMKRLGIPTARIQGGQKQTDRKQIVEDFNSGKVKALLVSSAGGEGFDLKGTRQVQVLEPHWNDEKINQVIGRAVRHQSHSHLPEEDRKVTVERYIAAPRSIFGTKKRGVEDYLQDMSDYKTLLNNQVIDLMVKKAVDKEAAKWREMVRAGTLSQKEILRLRRAGLLDYGKEIAGLERGTDAILKRFGVKQIYHGKKKPPSLESGLAESMGTALHGDTGKLHVYPRQEVLEPVRSQHRAMMAVVRRHEADEARALHRITGTITPQSPEHIAKVGPVKMMEDRFRENFFFHASPEVIMREQRNAALMPKPMQEAWTKVRSGRGDYEAARELLGGTDLTRANIKKARRHYAQMGSGAQAKFQEKHMQAAGYEV